MRAFFWSWVSLDFLFRDTICQKSELTHDLFLLLARFRSNRNPFRINTYEASVSVHSKGLTAPVTSLESTLTKNPGGVSTRACAPDSKPPLPILRREPRPLRRDSCQVEKPTSAYIQFARIPTRSTAFGRRSNRYLPARTNALAGARAKKQNRWPTDAEMTVPRDAGVAHRLKPVPPTTWTRSKSGGGSGRRG